ncbi:hypothetical protein L218DRAFT_952500 [Marasmius fiardii PR-910]|nr:hypothetical protein L218DRAFT_952500 [Marasmius fiardii PR-910]
MSADSRLQVVDYGGPCRDAFLFHLKALRLVHGHTMDKRCQMQHPIVLSTPIKSLAVYSEKMSVQPPPLHESLIKSNTIIFSFTNIMFFSARAAIATVLASLATLQADALPYRCTRAVGDITVRQLDTIINSTSCANASFPEECRTAEQALPFVNKAFADFGIATVGEKAAILSLMSFESGGFKFNINHFPSPRPGQGTRNMMLFPFIYQYAVDAPSTSAKALELAGPDPNNPSITNDTMNAVRALVLPDELSFASASWFYKRSGSEKKGCTGDAGVVKGLQSASVDGWANYVTKCIGTTVTPDRQKSYTIALNALQRR